MSNRSANTTSELERVEFGNLLELHRTGQSGAQDRLITMIHTDLRHLARRQLSGNRWIGTLNTTALVSESYLRLVSPAAQHVLSRAHFLNLAARVMRQVICDYARAHLRKAQHRSEELLAERHEAELTQARQFIGLDLALAALAKLNPRQAQVIDCRFFAGFSEEETAVALNISSRTVQRDWLDARLWLAEHIEL